MIGMYCNFDTPVYLKNYEDWTLQPITFAKKIYIPDDKKIFAVLEQIGLLQDFIQSTRIEANCTASKWLKNKGLLNEGFLENICKYWLEKPFKTNLAYHRCSKNTKNNPEVSEKTFKTVLKQALIFNELQNKNYEFNEFVSSELKSILKEEYAPKKEFSIYPECSIPYLMAKFINLHSINLVYELEEINHFELCIDTTLSLDDIKINLIGNILDYKNLNFVTAEFIEAECIKHDVQTHLEIKLASNRHRAIDLINKALECAEDFTYNRHYLEYEYISSLLNLNSEKHLSIIKSLNSMTYLNNFEDKTSKPLFERTITAVSPQDEQLMLHTGRCLIDKYDNIKNSNISLLSKTNLTNISAAINLNPENIETINTHIFNKKDALQSKAVKLGFNKDNTPYTPIGYATLK